MSHRGPALDARIRNPDCEELVKITTPGGPLHPVRRPGIIDMQLIRPVVALLLVAGGLTAAEPKANDPAKVFGFTNVWQLHLDLTAKEFAALDPGPVGFPGFGGPKGPNP